mmetsp:Transcript_30716/g.30212  ORF Transcript_30716/g.30212 Transcript_30716/m.30212 type:complete len:140 (+) Transcript_30716:1945-2364(+)
MFFFTNFVPDLIILTVSIVCVDIGLHHAHRSIKFLRNLKEEQLEKRRMQRLERDSAKILKTKTFSYGGFAYSGEAGNDPLVIEGLTSTSPKTSLAQKSEFGLRGYKLPKRYRNKTQRVRISGNYDYDDDHHLSPKSHNN